MSAIEGLFQGLFVSPWYWLVGGLVVAGLEIVVPGVFLLWIGLGALLIGLSLLVLPDIPVVAQLFLFSASMLGSVGLGFVLQRKSAKMTDEAGINQELQGLVGRHCEAAADFAAGRGRIRVGDTTYSAASDDAIRAGDIVVIVAVEQGTLAVRLDARPEGLSALS